VVAVLALVSVFLVAWQFFTIKSTGIPLNSAARLPDAVAQIIRTQERYLPSLHRNPNKDRFRLDLLVVSVADPTKQETFSLTRTQDRSALQPMTKILGADGDVVWVQAPELIAVNRKTKRVARLKDLQRLNPELQVFLHTARFEFTNHLVAVSPDWQQAYAFSGETLRASASPPPARGNWLETRMNETLDGSLCSGGLLAATDWFGVLAATDIAGNFKQGFSLPREFQVNTRDESRQLYHGRIDPDQSRPRVVAMDRISEVAYRSAAMIRDTAGGAMLRLTNPDSALMLYRASGDLNAPLALARVKTEGKTAWVADTGIGALKQILPHSNIVAFIGDRPAVPNKLPETILVLLNTTTGVTNTVSLWR